MESSGAVVIEQGRLKAISQRLKDKYGAKRVILFGSAARGLATEHSDIDLFIIAETPERFYERIASVLRCVRDQSQSLPLAPIVLTPEELEVRISRADQFIQEILRTGVDL